MKKDIGKKRGREIYLERVGEKRKIVCVCVCVCDK